MQVESDWDFSNYFNALKNTFFLVLEIDSVVYRHSPPRDFFLSLCHNYQNLETGYRLN